MKLVIVRVVSLVEVVIVEGVWDEGEWGEVCGALFWVPAEVFADVLQ